jgi:hypothetical protein
MKVTGVSAQKAAFIKQNCAKTELLKIPDYNDYDLVMALKKCAE